METFAFTSAVRGYHVCPDVSKPLTGEKLVAKREFDNPMDKHAVKVVTGIKMVGYLPREYSVVFSLYIISVEVIS